MKLLNLIRQGWNYCVGPINPNNEQFNVRTRFKMALLSFFVLTSVFIFSFYCAVRSVHIERTQLFLDFAIHISYVLGAVVASYIGLQSIWPSQNAYWSGAGNVTNVFRKAQEPPVGPASDDAQVD